MARFFIDRPIFAWVIAIIIMLAGALSITTLPVSMYPEVAPPAIEINITYPGASAKVVEDSVTQVIEQNMTGLDGLLYFSSSSSSNGRGTVTLTFETGTSPDIAQVQVQNKLQLAMPLLPQEVQRQGVEVVKSRSGFLQVVGFISEDNSMNENDIADYIGSNIVEPLSRVPGVGRIQVFGGKYAMRIWLDPGKLHGYRVSVDEITAAIRGQNAQVAIGQLGGAPAIDGQQLNATVSAQGRLQTPEEFRNIVVRSEADGSVLRLGDIARVELGAESYDFVTRYNRSPSTGIAVSLASGANALETAAAVSEALDKLRPNFPTGLKSVIPFDTTPFVRVSIKGVLKTLAEAIALVFVVMYLFLQNFRATLIPTIAVPVVLLGTFGVLAALGFSINTLTMFAMVLAIGLLVDDAIVVVENVERIMSEEGLSPLEATRKSMDQITGALIGIGLVLSAVFVPMAFMGGATGVIYRQFSATIVSAMALSVLVAIVLTPALCATMLKPLKKGQHHTIHRGPAQYFFDGFNNAFDSLSRRCRLGVGAILLRPLRFVAIYIALSAVMVVLFMRLPGGFLPNEDQGVLIALVQTPSNATQERTLDAIYKLEDHFLENEKEAVQSVFAVQGFSFSGMGQNAGLSFIKLKDWDKRDLSANGVGAVTGRAWGALGQIRDAFIVAFPPPAMPELGIANGFDMYLKDSNAQGHEALINARNMLLGMASQNPKLMNVRPNGQEDAPQLRVDIDVAKAGAHGLNLDAINNTLATAWGSSYVDDFIDRGRVKRVFLQGEQSFRMNPEDFQHWSVKNRQGEMVPFSAFASYHWDYGSPQLKRYNGVSAVQIQGEAKPGISSGEAMVEMEKIVQHPAFQGFDIEWTAVSYQERQAGSQLPLLYSLSLLIVFLCLAALYESWSVPTAVLLVAPMGILGAVLANTLRGFESDIYFQVAMLTTVGLTSKNAILIVEFAKENLEKNGMGLIEATLHAVRDRLRPILMTSLAFGLGVLPLVIASGAGSGAQRAIGTGVLGGMIVGTALGIFFTSLFFVVVQKLFNPKANTNTAANAAPQT